MLLSPEPDKSPLDTPSPQRTGRTLAVAVSGGIGSGKSTVCRMLAELGAEVFDSDAVARDLMRDDARLRAEIERAFGKESYFDDGSLNAGRLASTIFSNDEQRRLMNSIVHPRVGEAFRSALLDAESRDVPILVHESALITEVANLEVFDAIVIVRSPLSTRLDRALRRGGASRGDLESRARLQPTDADYQRVADYTIENDGSLDDLHAAVAGVHSAILARGARDATPMKHRER